ncbi:hypothetical protein SAMN05421736_104116 [Evansella caseinilytica]|uniref:Uncharacterized protein n=1 Tax=Evansella caseinilytica TaxID=1503961 RepID=A0A1H3NKW2_9BACI|nr:FeoB-associated Cys-rich membrane protein [Evansella caseinilytica]SDY89566.1 hypothetical protein SAMN05421736_104116 [Evansella caseinilytica]
MNRVKSYRLLAMLLFFAFVSLLARSIVYFIVAIIVALVIFYLLKKGKDGD